MSENIAQVIYYVNSALSLGMTYYGFTRVFQPAVKKRWILLAYLGFLLFSSQQYFQFDNLWLNLLVNTGAFIAISLLFSGNLSARFVFALLTYIITMVADVISFTGLSYLYYRYHGIQMPTIYIHTVERTVTNIIFLPLFLIFLLLFRRYFVKKASYQRYSIPKSYTVSILLILAGIILLDVLFFAIAITDVGLKIGQIIAAQFIVLVTVFLIIWFYIAILDYVEELEQSKLKDQMLERWQLQYVTVMDSQKALAEARHNLRYTLLTLAGYLREGNTEDAEKHLKKELGKITYVVKTGNMSIDTMINYYRQRAENELDLELETDLLIPPHMELDSGLVVTILGNALENAMEACEKVEPSQRYLKFKATYIKKDDAARLLIVITNPYAVAPVADSDGNLLTTKGTKRKYGLGLASMKEILPEKTGQIHCEFEEDVFRFMLVLYDIQTDGAAYTTSETPFMTSIE